MTAMSFIILIGAVLFMIILTLGKLVLVHFRQRRVTKQGGVTVGIFHPYCNAGGGGEKVLWCAIRALQKQFPNADIAVYTGDTNATSDEILQRASTQLNTSLLRPVKFVYLRSRSLLEAWRYPICTLLGQSLGSIIVGTEAMMQYLPDVYIDTMGYAFTMPVFSLVGGCRVGCYVHYPVITKDMLQRVSDHVAAHNNRPLIAQSPFLTSMKLVYYQGLAWLYKMAGSSASLVMVNSSWTKDHIEELWGRKELIHLVYPPCDVKPMQELKKSDTYEFRIVSLAQFRPEKDHPLQIKIFQQIKARVAPEVWPRIKLVMIGSCRNSEDEERVKNIKMLAEKMSVSENVEFKVNITFKEVLEQFIMGTVGLHTMWNEHFGIGVVECMAAGLIMVAHKSGGPMMDIIDDRKDGYLAATAEQYAQTIVHILDSSPDKLQQIGVAARKSTEKFSLEAFEEKFLAAISAIIDAKKKE